MGGGFIGCELALELTDEGKEVTVVEFTDKLAASANMLYREALSQHLEKAKSLHILTEHACQKLTGHSVLVSGKDGTIRELPCDSVIVSVGMVPKKEEAFSLYGITPDTYIVGDCSRVATVLEATNESYFIGANL